MLELNSSLQFNLFVEAVAWSRIEFNHANAIENLLPESLVPHLTDKHTALEIGCNKGIIASFLAEHGLNVLGIDVNSEAIKKGCEIAVQNGLCERISLHEEDIIEASLADQFDVIVMIRLLTCFPSVDRWRSLLNRVNSWLKHGGILYVHDFALDCDNPAYKKRYEEGVLSGGRFGSFAVNDSSGNFMLVAHHHSDEEIQEIVSPYHKIKLDFHESLSMNGNPCKMFEFIGEKRS